MLQFIHRAISLALCSGWLVACAGFQAPQAHPHNEADFVAEVRARAAAKMACDGNQLQIEPSGSKRYVGSKRYAVDGCAQRTFYCCHERALSVFCEAEDTTAPQACREAPLEAPPEVERVQPVTAEDYGLTGYNSR